MERKLKEMRKNCQTFAEFVDFIFLFAFYFVVVVVLVVGIRLEIYFYILNKYVTRTSRLKTLL